MGEHDQNRKKLTPRKQRELDISIEFLEGVVRRDPVYTDAIKLLADDYTQRGKFTAGLELDERLAQLQPNDPLVQYNLACSYSLTGHLPEAAAAVEKALELGYREFTWLDTDPDLKALRADPSFQKIRAKIKDIQPS